MHTMVRHSFVITSFLFLSWSCEPDSKRAKKNVKLKSRLICRDTNKNTNKL